MSDNPNAGNKTKSKHHYIPRMYLEGFTEDEKLCVWKREDGSIRPSKPVKEARVKGFYTFIDQHGNENDDIESLLEDIENKAKPIFNNINCLFPQTITGYAKEVLCVYLAFQLIRTIEQRKQSETHFDMIMKLPALLNIRTREDAIKTLKSTGRNVTEESVQHILDFVNNPHHFYIKPHKNELIKSALKVLPELVSHLEYREWHIFTFKESPLITSDSPVIMLPDERKSDYQFRGVGPANAKEIWFPISSTRLAVLKHCTKGPPSTIPGCSELAKQANGFQAGSSYIETFGPPSVIEEFRGHGLGSRPLMQVDSGLDKAFFQHYNKPPENPRPVNR